MHRQRPAHSNAKTNPGQRHMRHSSFPVKSQLFIMNPFLPVPPHVVCIHWERAARPTCTLVAATYEPHLR